MNKSGMSYVDVFNSGRDFHRPLLTLYDDESILLLFELVSARGEMARKYFEDGRVGLVAFNTAQEFQTGTGSYAVIDGGKIEVRYETGVLKGVLERLHLERIIDTEKIHRLERNHDHDHEEHTRANAAPGNNGSNGN